MRSFLFAALFVFVGAHASEASGATTTHKQAAIVANLALTAGQAKVFAGVQGRAAAGVLQKRKAVSSGKFHDGKVSINKGQTLLNQGGSK